MINRRNIIGGALGAVFVSSALAEARADGRIFAGDVAVLREAYESLHPGLYRYNTRPEMNARFEALARDWSRHQSLAQAYLSLSGFLATIKCGHTYANFYNQSDAVHQQLFTARDRLPFRFVWLEERMVVTENLSGDPRLAAGAEIVSVNGVRGAALLRHLIGFVRADGSNDAKRTSLLEVQGVDEYETFDLFYSLLHPEAARGFSLRVRPAGGRQAERVEVGPVERTQVRGGTRESAMNMDAPAWRLAYHGARVARLIMPGWALYNSDWDWRGFLDASFEELQARGITRLIVDLRGNEGGLDCGHEIIARLIDRDLPLAAYERRVRYQRTPDHLNQYLDTWDDSFRNWGDDAIRIDDRYFRLRSSAQSVAPVIAPKGPRFRGDLVVLIDSSNSSATFQFANLIKANGLGRLIGSPTGGNLRGINGGAFFFLRLAESGLECDLPLIATFPPTPMPDAGIEPDMRVTRTANDIATGRDAVLEAALA
ncbi:MAG: S41 family peptidase [Caulobacterales bacterium]